MQLHKDAYAMKRVAAGALLPTPWIFEPTKRPDDRAYYCLGCITVEIECKKYYKIGVDGPRCSKK